MNIFSLIFYQPIFNLLIYLYNVIPGRDLGVAIIALTLIIRLLLYWPSKKAIVSQKELAGLQPEIDELKEKYRDDKDKMGPAMMELYKKKKINPFSSCLPLLIQLPFLFAIYRVFYDGLTKPDAMSALYSFVANPGSLNTMAFGFFDLAKKSIWLAVLAGLAQFWQSKMMTNKKKQSGMAGAMGSQMLYLMPIFTIIIGAQFPAGLTFYWLLTTLFSIVQQYIVFKTRKRVEVVEK
jgi:YidC/Oxa1 family membrane protein insertase